MKTAVSIPDDLFEAADELAARLEISRSELYAQALRAHVSALHARYVTAKLDAAYREVDSTLPADIAAATRRAMRDVPW